MVCPTGMLLYPFAVVIACGLTDEAGKILGDMLAVYFVSVAQSLPSMVKSITKKDVKSKMENFEEKFLTTSIH